MTSTPKDERERERRDQLVACAETVAKLAKHREIEAANAPLVRYDLEVRRVLDTIVRRWTLLTPTRLTSTGAANTSSILSSRAGG